MIAYPSKGSDKDILNKLRKKANSYKTKAHFKLIPNSKLNQLVLLYQMSNTLILPSELEMAPLSILESFACGTPCLATNVGNVEEALSKVDSNLILKSGDSNDILSGLEYFLSLPTARLDEIRKNGKLVAKDYSGTKSAKIFIRASESLVT